MILDKYEIYKEPDFTPFDYFALSEIVKDDVRREDARRKHEKEKRIYYGMRRLVTKSSIDLRG